MKHCGISRITSSRTTLLATIALAALAGAAAPLYAQSVDNHQASRKLLPIQNRRFKAGADQGAPAEHWRFESLSLTIDPKASSAHIDVAASGPASASRPKEGKGVLLHSREETARGDLISAPLPLKPFRRVEVRVEYVVESGKPLAFVCLRPADDRSLVDLDFLPQPATGEKSRATAKLHTGTFDGDYSIAISITGKGVARILSVRAYETGEYIRPKKPVFVLDMLHVEPPSDGRLGWTSCEKLVDVFGFPSIEHLHFSEVTAEKLAALDPAFVVLSPMGEHLSPALIDPLQKAVRTAVDYGSPVVGICLGHQVLALSCSDVGMDRASEWGPTRIKITAEDPIFTGLPRSPWFYASESHNGIVNPGGEGVEIIASTMACPTQVLRYSNKQWYTFQCHIEREWEFSCPEAYLIWKNMFNIWGLTSDG